MYELLVLTVDLGTERKKKLKNIEKVYSSILNLNAIMVYFKL